MLRKTGRCQGFSARCAHGHMVVSFATGSERWGFTGSERGGPGSITSLSHVQPEFVTHRPWFFFLVPVSRVTGVKERLRTFSCPHPLPADTAAHWPPPGGPFRRFLCRQIKHGPKKETRAVVFECFRFHTNCPRSWIRGPPSQPLVPVGTPSPKSNIANISIAAASAGAATHARRRPESNE